MNILKFYKKGGLIIKDDNQKEILDQLIQVDDKISKLKLKKKKLIKKKKKVDKLILQENGIKNKLANKINLSKYNYIPLISIGFDKRSSTYNCIYHTSKYKYSFYIGNQSKIRNFLKPYYESDINNFHISDLIKEVIEIIKFYFFKNKISSNTINGQKLRFKNIMDYYDTYGNWTYWSAQK
tara:strand:+ start:2594 stop:3136 length:543 start_codon:yes stop_codon:yes gene_type:complete